MCDRKHKNLLLHQTVREQLPILLDRFMAFSASYKEAPTDRFSPMLLTNLAYQEGNCSRH